MREELAYLKELIFPCPQCGHNVVNELLKGAGRCPECRANLPDVLHHPHPAVAWMLATGKGPIRR